jgi:hypothetical protein
MATLEKLYCFKCNTEMRIDLDAFIVVGIGGKKDEENLKPNDLNSKNIESKRVRLTSCPFCKKQEKVIDEDVQWLSMAEILKLIPEGRLISNNPEIELLFKILVLSQDKK